ncbi:Dabb family protein [Amnibacterium flavum]|uniref:Stress responsive protein n=1 Tax=Amnibacterium flavum TaxID=2173173 RepID=A0A2V1HQ35_9MICO|nr:Dabb family protein [Amnibacterium flavum]PVZ94645.1 stress responsive protein [Amnibacterium flavum]
MTAIRHLVLVGWRGSASDEVRDEARVVARGLAGAIPGIAALEEGPSVSPEGLEAGYDWALSILFDNEAARDGYLVHPAHAVLADIIGEHRETIAVFDLAV